MRPERARPAVFADRDGTLIVDVGYPRDPAAVRLLPGAGRALRELQEAGWLVVVVSNQSGIGRGIVSPEQARTVHERFLELLGREAVVPDAVKYCPHAPQEGCACRKPAPGMLLEAASELGVDLPASAMVGDKTVDVEAGRRAGCGRTILLSIEGAHAGGGAEAGAVVGSADLIAESWQDALAFILRETAAR